MASGLGLVDGDAVVFFENGIVDRVLHRGIGVQVDRLAVLRRGAVGARPVFRSSQLVMSTPSVLPSSTGSTGSTS